MADATPRKYIYGIILFTLVVVSGISFLGLFGDEITGSTKYGEFNESMNKLSSVNSQIDDLEDRVVNPDVDFGAFGVLNALISGAWKTLTLLGSSLGFMSAAFGGLSAVFGIPMWITGLVSLLVVVMIIFTVYSAIFQTEL